MGLHPRKWRGVELRRRLTRATKWVIRRRSPAGRHLRPKSSQSKQLTLVRPRKCDGYKRLFDLGHQLLDRLISSCGGGGEPDPPKGHLAVYVGGGRREEGGGKSRRYWVPVIQVNHPLFGELLREAEAEFGFCHPRGITIPCSVSRFECVRTRIAAGEPRRSCANVISCP